MPFHHLEVAQLVLARGEGGHGQGVFEDASQRKGELRLGLDDGLSRGARSGRGAGDLVLLRRGSRCLPLLGPCPQEGLEDGVRN
eukprot:4364855-Heterocapsa_arctica.AAC.1